MRITITGRKIEISDALREYADKKLNKLEKYFCLDSQVGCVLSIERGRQKVEVTVNHNGIIFRAQDSTTDMYASVRRSCGCPRKADQEK